MLRTADGDVVDVVLNPLTIVSRVNPSQVVEAALGKAAHKAGQPYMVNGFDGQSAIEFAMNELKKHGLSDTEDLLDPTRNAKMRKIFTGRRFFMKLHHMAEAKGSARSATGEEDVAYTSDKTPAKGGASGAKRLSVQDVYALLAHGATHTLRDSHKIRGQRNDDYWRALRLGLTPPTPKSSFVHEKFFHQLKAAGINTEKKGNALHILALTDRDTDKLSRGEITSSKTVDHSTLEPIEGGLFDVRATGGHDGPHWSHFTLAEPMPSPVMEDVTRNLLGLTKNQFEGVIAGKEQLRGSTGPSAILKALSGIHVDQEISSAKEEVRSGKATRRDKAVKRLGYLQMFKDTGLQPADLVWSKVPVLPPAFRPISKLGPKTTLVADANSLYKDALDANKALGAMSKRVDESQVGDERLTLYKSLKAVAGLGDPVGHRTTQQKAKGILERVFGSSPKHGIIQRNLISAPQDMVGRAVVTPDPSLDIDEVGLPEESAWQMYSPFLIRRLVRAGARASDAATLVERRDPRAKKELLEEMESRPILMNRAPTLHRFSIQAFWPRLSKGDTLRVPPVITQGYGMDFDGDAANFYVPISDEARDEAIEKMLPSKNLLDSTTFGVHFLPRQEYLHGLFVASSANSGRKPRLFRSSKEVAEAFKRGEINMGDPVTIQDD